MLNVNMFNSFVMLRIFDKSDNALIVIEDNNRLQWFKKSNLLK